MELSTRQGKPADRVRKRWLASVGLAVTTATSLSGCSLLGEWDEPFAYQEVVIPESVAEPGSRFEYRETALLPLEDGREVAVTFTQVMTGLHENAGLAEIGPDWTTPGSMNVTIGMQGDAAHGVSALPPDLVGILDDGSVAARATVEEAPDAVACDLLLQVPEQDDADSQQLRCAIYLVPAGRELIEVRWVPVDAESGYQERPVTWRVPSMEELMTEELAKMPTPTS